MAEYQSIDKHNNTVKEIRNSSIIMSNKNQEIKITFSTTNETKFEICLKNIIENHCK